MAHFVRLVVICIVKAHLHILSILAFIIITSG